MIRARRLDADEAEEVTVEATVPSTEAGQRAQLIDLVQARYPEAEFRSFANEAASFLATKVLIVAVYRRSPDQLAETSPQEDEAQQQLFVA